MPRRGGGVRAPGIIRALNEEWSTLVRERADEVADWAARWDNLAGCRTLDDILGLVPASPDAVLGALLAESERGHDLAARAVLQAVLGRIVVMASRDRFAGTDDYVSALWCVIRRYPLAARPARIAANLALDTLKTVTQERLGPRAGEVCPWPPEQLILFLGAADEAEVGADAVLMAGVDLGVIDMAAKALLRSVYVDGLTGREAALRHGRTHGSVRVLCSRAVGRLAMHAVELRAAA